MKKNNFFSLPTHVAIIPDGNRRWAKRQGREAWEGHEEGAKRIEEIVREALKIGIKYLTFWGSSVDNLTKRSLMEKRALFRIYESYFGRLIKSEEVFENEVAIKVFGRWEEQFPPKLKNILKEGIEKTKKFSRHFLNFLLAYNGDDEMILAIEKIVQKAIQFGGKIKLDFQSVKENLLTGSLPEVDLLIRTGSENDPHNSAGFMMWHTRNSQYFFSPKMMPEFNAKLFREAIDDYQQRIRRFGK